MKDSSRPVHPDPIGQAPPFPPAYPTPPRPLNPSSPNRIHVHIDRLVLDGLPFTGRDAARFRAGIESELSRLLSERSDRHLFASQDLNDSNLTGELQIPPNDPSFNIGRNAAASLLDLIINRCESVRSVASRPSDSMTPPRSQ